MKKVVTVGILIGALLLSGCAARYEGATPDFPATGGWKLTEVGDVFCMESVTGGGYTVTDCDWTTLTSQHERTADDAGMMTGEYIWIEGHDEQVYCIHSITEGGYKVRDCNYDGLVRH